MNHVKPISDQELVRCFLNGQDACFETLVVRHKTKVYSTIYLIVQDSYLAEDLFQETFIKAFKVLKSGRYQEEDKFAAWVVRMARNLAIDYIRKVKRGPSMVTAPEGGDVFDFIHIAEPSTEDKIIHKDMITQLRDLINQLPEEQREVLVLRHYGDLSFKEIARITNVPLNTSLGRMRYALNNLRKLIVQKHIQLQ